MRRTLSTVALTAGIVLLMGKTCDEDPPADDQQYWLTCGDPVCQGYTGPTPDVPLCTDEGIVEGDVCPVTDDGIQCDPEDGCNAMLLCAADDPTQQTGGCPISLAKHKEQIQYLKPGERAQAHREVMEMKLATWRYRASLDDGKQHMGFLIDDMPGSAAVRADGGHVDLYGYTSLAVAALQHQQAQIDALQADIAALKASCE